MIKNLILIPMLKGQIIKKIPERFTVVKKNFISLFLSRYTKSSRHTLNQTNTVSHSQISSLRITFYSQSSITDLIYVIAYTLITLVL